VIDGELGSFLRSRREALSPADAGLSVGTRRRTPGLRRSELATLAGVSVDYLIRLEQGRDTRPSAQVLAALADALQLGDDDLDYLRLLSAVSHGTELCPSAQPAARTVRPSVQAILDRMEPSPAFVLNHLTDLIAWNDGYERLAGPLGIIDGETPNLVWFTFTDARARAAYPDWDDIADEQVSNLFIEHHGGDPAAAVFVERLAEAGGAPFTDRWARGAVARKRTGVKAVAHPKVGLLRLAFETLELPDADRQRMVIYLPADAATSTGLDRLAGREPGALRSVSSA
jgi:transcriptional regulator with XRE-family HTH domain